MRALRETDRRDMRLTESFMIAVAESGTESGKNQVSTFYWPKGCEDYREYEKLRNLLLEPENYLKMIKGEKIQKECRMRIFIHWQSPI